MFTELFRSSFFKKILLIIARPIASLLGLVLGWTFLEGEVAKLFAPEDREPTPEETRKQAMVMLGLIAGLFVAGWLLGAGAKGKIFGRRR